MIEDCDVPKLREKILSVLKVDLSLARVREDDDGDISFTYEGQKHLVIFEEDDAEYLRIMIPCLYCVHEDRADEISLVDRSAVQANYVCKAAKISRTTKPDKDGDYVVCMTIEFIVTSLDSVEEAILERYLSLLKSCSNTFRSNLAELTKDRNSDKSPRGSIGVVH